LRWLKLIYWNCWGLNNMMLNIYICVCVCGGFWYMLKGG